MVCALCGAGQRSQKEWELWGEQQTIQNMWDVSGHMNAFIVQPMSFVCVCECECMHIYVYTKCISWTEECIQTKFYNYNFQWSADSFSLWESFDLSETYKPLTPMNTTNFISSASVWSRFGLRCAVLCCCIGSLTLFHMKSTWQLLERKSQLIWIFAASFSALFHSPALCATLALFLGFKHLFIHDNIQVFSQSDKVSFDANGWKWTWIKHTDCSLRAGERERIRNKRAYHTAIPFSLCQAGACCANVISNYCHFDETNSFPSLIIPMMT